MHPHRQAVRHVRQWFTALERPAAGIINIVASPYFLAFTLGMFTLEATFFAIRIRYGLPPDENYHYSFVQLLALHWPLPAIAQQHGYAVAYDAMRTPFFLYHYLLVLPYLMTRSLGNDYVFLRLLNVALVFGSLLTVVQLAGQLRISRLARNLGLFALTNTLMFVFLAGAISYDNLFVLICLLTMLAVIKLYQRVTVTWLLILIVLLLAGSMVKLNFLPFGFAAAVIIVVVLSRRPSATLQALKQTAAFHKHYNLLFAGIVILLAALGVSRYGVNLVRYHSYNPPCTSYRSLEACDTSTLFMRAQYLQAHPLPVTMSLPHYAYTWSVLMLERTYGIFAHKRFAPPKAVTALMALFVTVGLVGVIMARQSKLVLLLIGVITFYGLALFIDNYGVYRAYGRADLAVHGRYLFGVLPMIYLLLCGSILGVLKSKQWQAAYVVLVIVLFAVSNVPLYIANTDAGWYVRPLVASSGR